MGLLSQKLRSGVLELATETGPLYVSPTLLERAYLLWTFRNFPRLSRVVLNERQQELIDKLCRTPNLRHRIPADVPILGVIENVTLASQRKNVAAAAAVVTINSAEAQLAQVVGASLRSALARVQGREPVLDVRAVHANERVTPVRKDKKITAQAKLGDSPALVKPWPGWGIGEKRPKWLTPAVALSAAAVLLAGFMYVRPNRAAPETVRLRLDQSYAPLQAPLTATAEKPASRGVAEALPKPSAARAVGQASTAAVPLRPTPGTYLATPTMNKSAAAVLPLSTYAPPSRIERPAQSTAIAAPPPNTLLASGVARETSVNAPAVSRIVISAAPLNFGYPIAPKATLLGKVHLRIVIGSDGSVKDVSALSGNPELADAAVKAVRRWKYRPPVMNGQAVEAETNVTINFAGDDAVTIAYR